MAFSSLPTRSRWGPVQRPHTDRETERETAKQRDRQTETETEKERETRGHKYGDPKAAQINTGLGQGTSLLYLVRVLGRNYKPQHLTVRKKCEKKLSIILDIVCAIVIVFCNVPNSV